MSDNDGDRAGEVNEEEQTEEVDAVAMEVIRRCQWDSCQRLCETEPRECQRSRDCSVSVSARL